MMKHDFVVEIKAPLEKVFAFTTDFRNLATWQEALSEASQLPDGPTQLDTKFRLVSTLLGKRMEAAGEVTEFASNQKLAFKTTSSPIQLNVTTAYAAIPGGTSISIHLEAEPGGFFKLAEGAMDRQLKSVFESQVQKLRAVLET